MISMDKMKIAAGSLIVLAVYGITLWMASIQPGSKTSSASALVGIMATLGGIWAVVLAAGLRRQQSWAPSGARVTGWALALISVIAGIDTVRRVLAQAVGTEVTDVIPAVVFGVGGFLLATLLPARSSETA